MLYVFLNKCKMQNVLCGSAKMAQPCGFRVSNYENSAVYYEFLAVYYENSAVYYEFLAVYYEFLAVRTMRIQLFTMSF